MRWSETGAGSVATLLALLALLHPLQARGQEIFVEGAADHPAAALLRDIVARGDFRLLDRDTVLGAGVDLAQDVVVLDARVVLEGTVRGAVAVVDGALFLRPGARVTGPVAEIAGTLFTSGTASVGERRALPLEVRTEVAAVAGGYRVTLDPPARPPLLALPRAFGVAVPTFDRVDGLTVGWGIGINPGRDTTGTRGWAEVLYHTERGEWGGAVGAEAPLNPGLWLSLRAESRSVTPDEWVRADLVNSAAAVVFRSDARDYYHADRVALSVERRQTRPLQQGEGFFGPRVGLLLSRDRSLQAGDPWTLFGRDDPWRPNPPVTEGTIASATAGAEVAWRGATLDFGGDLAVEWAPGSVGDVGFTHLVAEGAWRMTALWGHSVALRARTHLPLGDAGAPPQRWSFVGGPGTIPTFEPGLLRGDRLAFVESRYVAPITRITLPLGGTPAVRLQHAAGIAWPTGTPMPRWEQNVGIGVELTVLEAMVFVNPGVDRLRPELHLGGSLPRF